MVDRDSRGGGGPEKSGDVSPVLIRALDHATRREALRLLHRSGEAMGAAEMSRNMRDAPTYVSYHLKILTDLGAVEPVGEREVGGVTERLFDSKVADHAQLTSILADTERDDEWPKG